MKLKTWTLWIPSFVLILGVLLPLELAAVVAPRSAGEGIELVEQAQQPDFVLDKKKQRKVRREERRAKRKAYRKARRNYLLVAFMGLLIWPLAIGISYLTPFFLLGPLVIAGWVVAFHSLLGYLIMNKKIRIAIILTVYISLALYGLVYAFLDALSGLTFF